MSKLDCFLVSESFYDIFPHATGVVLEKDRPDHRPILLKELIVDYGPTPFRFFHSWLELEGFHNLVVDTWNSDGNATELDHLNRCESARILGELDRVEASYIAQKARLKWAMEGDGNSSFFHATLKKNRHLLAIKGIRKDGEWIDNPDDVKTIFKEHFQNRFQQLGGSPPSFDVDMLHHLSNDQCEFLERNFSREEIKRAVWDCSRDRASGPDGFTFKIFTSFWDLLEPNVTRFVKYFFITGTFPKGCNSSFIMLIPKVSNATLVIDFRPISLIGCQYKIIGKILANRLSMVIDSCISPEQSAFIKGRNILDGPLILNEVMAWYRKRKKPLMIFKVDFKKKFVSLRWDFLDLIMRKLGFEIKWHSWIKGCLINARSSIWVNGSPSNEFEISRGLRLGDPLSPFLFILAMEGLHALICKALNKGIYVGPNIGNDILFISHLIYADDVIFTGEWSRNNAHNLLCILRCFYLVSDLKINVHKSNIFGICVFEEDAFVMANVIGCGAVKLPFKYLGVPMGCNMSLCSNWENIIHKFQSKLSNWKAPLLLLGGGEIGEKEMTWVSWRKCLAINKSGGFGIGSIFALNAGLLFKWVWRFLHKPTNLWVRLIKVLYGHNGGIFDAPTYQSTFSPWCGLLSLVKSHIQKGMDLLSLCVRKIGNGVNTRLWEDTWHGIQRLKYKFPLIFMLDNDKGYYVANRLSLLDWSSILRRNLRGGIESSQFLDLKILIGNVELSSQHDSWQWTLDVSKGFSVASIHSLIDSHTHDVGSLATRWNRGIPIEVNIFLWRLSLNKLPSRVNLDRKGIDVDSLLCLIFHEDVETVNHIFFSCEMAKDLWSLLARSWELDIPYYANITEWFSWLDSLSITLYALLFLEDKNIAISELKKLIEKCKGKYVETKYDKPSIVRQPNAQRIPKPSVLGKPTPFSDSLERKSFSKTKLVPKTNVSEGLSKPVTTQILPQTARQAVRNTNVIKLGMYQIDTRTTQTRAPQLPQTSRNTDPRVSTSTRANHRTNVSRPPLKRTQMKDKVVPNNSQVKVKKTEVEDHNRISSISNKTKSVTATKKPKVVPISTRKPKSQADKSVAIRPKKTVASESTIQKSKSYYRMLYEKTRSNLSNVPSSSNSLADCSTLLIHCTVHFGNDQFPLILGYGDLVQENIIINRVYYVEGLNHNLFFVGQFCDADLEVAFCKSTCFVRDLQGNDLLTGTSSVNKSSSPTDNSKQQDTPPTTIQSSTEPTTPTTKVNAKENNNNQAEDT
ncbi:RNA-directed DNA polymerase, eukaryota [Tanacetum coccineum]